MYVSFSLSDLPYLLVSTRLDFSMVGLLASLCSESYMEWPAGRYLLDEMSIVQSHGIPEEVIDNVVKAGKKYFSLPEAAKMEVSF